MKDLINTVKSGWLPWWLRWPVMLFQLALLPILVPAQLLVLCWEEGVPTAIRIELDMLRNAPWEFRECWIGKRRLW